MGSVSASRNLNSIIHASCTAWPLSDSSGETCELVRVRHLSVSAHGLSRFGRCFRASSSMADLDNLASLYLLFPEPSRSRAPAPEVVLRSCRRNQAPGMGLYDTTIGTCNRTNKRFVECVALTGSSDRYARSGRIL